MTRTGQIAMGLVLLLLPWVGPANADTGLLAPLNLEWRTFDLGHVTVHVDPVLLDRRAELTDAIDAYVARERPQLAEAQAAAADAETIAATLDRWIGADPALVGRSTGSELLAGMIAPEVSLTNADLPTRLYVVSEETLAHADSALWPRLTRDGRTGRLIYVPDLLGAGRSGQLEHVAVVRDDASLTEDLGLALDTLLPRRRLGPALAEYARQRLLRGWNGGDPYGRWFREGASVALAERALRDRQNAAAADALVSPYDPDADGQGVDLELWMSRPLDVPLPVEAERRLSKRRQAAAVKLVRGLVREHGPDTVGRLLNRASADQRPSGEALLKALDEQTRQRVEATRAFEDAGRRRAGLAEAFNQALREDRVDDALFAAKRLIELGPDVDASDYGRLALLLDKAGHPDHADRVLAMMVVRLRRLGDEHQLRLANELLVQYAVRTNRRSIGHAAAESVLRERPDDAAALLLRLDRQLQAGKLAQARLTAERLRESSEPGTLFRRAADRVLRNVRIGLSSEPAADSAQK